MEKGFNSTINPETLEIDSDLYGKFPWHHEINIEKVIHKISQTEDSGTLHKFRVSFDDEMMLGLNYYQAKDPASDMPVVITPALATGLHGRNHNIQKKLSEIGLSSLLIGTPGSERDSLVSEVSKTLSNPRKVINEIKAISLARHTAYVQEITRNADLFELNNEAVLGYGESRGAMILLGSIACQGLGNPKIVEPIAVAPCYIKPFDKDRVMDFTSQVIKEITSIGQVIGNLSINGLSTLNPSPKSILYEIGHIPTLFNGDTGHFASKIPGEQILTIIAFDQDVSGQAGEWIEALPRKKYPNINIEIIPGNHLSIARQSTLDYVIAKFKSIINNL